MTDATATAEVPVKPLGGLAAYLSVEGALKAAEFYGKAFGAETKFFYPPDEKGRTMHVHLYINGSSVMLGDAYPEHGHPFKQPQGFTMQLFLEEANIDEWWDRAVKAGCEVVNPLQPMFWGDKWGSLRDPFGIDWAMNAPVSKK
jgi:uncharacterized glyoxalase superfamily protein PhnB